VPKGPLGLSHWAAWEPHGLLGLLSQRAALLHVWGDERAHSAVCPQTFFSQLPASLIDLTSLAAQQRAAAKQASTWGPLA
jgi:hypothetical protein